MECCSRQQPANNPLVESHCKIQVLRAMTWKAFCAIHGKENARLLKDDSVSYPNEYEGSWSMCGLQVRLLWVEMKPTLTAEHTMHCITNRPVSQNAKIKQFCCVGSCTDTLL